MSKKRRKKAKRPQRWITCRSGRRYTPGNYRAIYSQVYAARCAYWQRVAGESTWLTFA